MKKNRMTLMASTVLIGVVVILYTGHIYSANAQGAINPQTGEFYPGTGGSIDPNTGMPYQGYER